jgi:hypothetical protein
MRRKVALVLSLGITVVSPVVRAGTNFALTVQIDAGKPSKCTLATVNDAAAKDDGLKVALVSTKNVAQPASEGLTLTLDGEPEVPRTTIAKGQMGAELARGAYVNRKLTLADPTKPVKADGCGPLLMTAPQTAASDDKPPQTLVGEANMQATELNQKAMAYLASEKITNHGVGGGVLGRHYRLYHLPDGTPAFPLPMHVNEKDQVEIWAVMPIGTKATVDVVACDKAPGFRIRGSYKDAAGAAGKLQGLEEVTFALQAYPSQLQCAGTLTYKIDTSGQSTTTSISIDPVYRFEWGVGYGFDFGKPQKLSLGDRAPASGTGTEKFVVASNDFTGAKPIITLGVDVCGTNPADMNWCDRLLMPSIWVDPTRLSQGFGVGLVFRPIFGVGILAGLSIFQSTALSDGLTAKPGDTWTAAGDLPTKKVFNGDSLGFMLAATLDTEIFAALVP